MSEVTSGQAQAVIKLALELYETAPNYATPVGLEPLKKHVEMLERRKVFVDATVVWLEEVIETTRRLTTLLDANEVLAHDPGLKAAVDKWKELMK